MTSEVIIELDGMAVKLALKLLHSNYHQEVKNYASDPDLRGIEGTDNLGTPDSVGLFSLTFMNKNKAGQPFLKDFEVIIFSYGNENVERKAFNETFSTSLKSLI